MASTRTFRWAAALSVVLTMAFPSAGQPDVAAVEDAEPPPAERYFTCLWQSMERTGPNTHLIVARVLKSEGSRAEGGFLTLQIERVIGIRDFTPVEVRMRIVGSRTLTNPNPDTRYMLSVLSSGGPTDGNAASAIRKSLLEDAWYIRPMTAHVYLWEQRRRTSLRTLAVPLPEPWQPWAAAFDEFATARNADGEEVDSLSTLQRCLASEHEPLRVMASQAACANAVRLNAPDDRATAYGKLILAENDPAVQRNLAKVYFNAPGDILPKDLSLLPTMLTQKHKETATLIALGGLSQVSTRRKAVAEKLRPLLTDGPAFVQLQILRGLSTWEREVLLLDKAISTLARNPARGEPAQQVRQLAVQLLLDAGGEADKLAMEVCVACPSAVVMEYLTERGLYAAVPKLIEAGRKKELRWSRATSLTVALLTGRLAMLSFEATDAWWREVEADGTVETMIETGFTGLQTAAAVEAALADLESRDFRRRREARRRLRELVPPIPANLREAAESSSAERRLTARYLISLTHSQTASFRQELTDLADLERATLIGWPG